MKRFLLLFSLLICTFFVANAQTPYFPGQIMVQLKPGHTIDEVISDLRNLDNQPNGLNVDFQVSKHNHIWLLKYDASVVSDSRMLFAARSHSAAQEAQFNHIISQRDTLVPDDAQLSDQWQWINNGVGSALLDADVDADGAWAITTGGLTAIGDTIVVCVVDDGTEYNHVDLQDNLWINHNEIDGNGIDDDGNGWIDDMYGWNTGADNATVSGGSHGVNVAGMIGAVGNNGIGGTGINWHVKIMTIKYGGASEASAIAAYEYPLIMRKLYNESNGAKGAYVVATNSSWGIDQGQPADAPLWCAYYDSLGVHGVLSVGATSNSNLNVDVVGDLPTACPSDYLISVARTGNTDNHAGGYGKTTVDLGAPGINIYTADNGGGYTTTTGTSFSSPLVAGMVGLLYSAPCPGFASFASGSPAEAALQVKAAILDGTDEVPALLDKVLTNGRANVHQSLLLLLTNCSSCFAPYGVSFSDITTSSANVQFTANENATFANLRYKFVLDETWTSAGNATSPFSLSDLVACSEYEVQLQSICGDSIGDWSSSYTFTTDGCCTAPVSSVEVIDGALAINWLPITAAETYTVQLTYGAQTYDFVVAAPNTSFTSNVLEPCTEVSWRVNANCGNELLGEGTWQTLTTSGCGACLDLTYCATQGINPDDEYIGNVTLGSLNNDSESASYSNFAGVIEAPELNQFATYNISLTPTFPGPVYNEAFRVWIDYNHDGDFADTDELIFDPGNTQTTIEGQVTIPGTATPGLTRMRVAMKYMGFNSSLPQPCTQFNYGEVEDYCVMIIDANPPACQLVEALDTVDVAETTVTLSWAEADSAISYDVRYKLTSGTAWTVLNNAQTPYAMTGLEDCTSYDFQVKAVCANGEVPFSETKTVITDCASGTFEFNSLSFSVQPNPFNNNVVIKSSSPFATNGTLWISNSLGQQMLQQAVVRGESQVTIQTDGAMPAGIYFLHLMLENGTQGSVSLIKN